MGEHWEPTRWEWFRIWLCSHILGEKLWGRAWRMMRDMEKHGMEGKVDD